MIQDAATAERLSKHPLVARLDAIIEAATAVYLEALDGAEKPICKRQPRQPTHPGSKQLKGTMVQSSPIQQCQKMNRTALPHRMMMMTPNTPVLHTEKGSSAHHSLQAQLSRLSDRTRLRRVKNTLHTKGAWQQVSRVEDLCHTHVSHLDACAGSVLTPHDYITNVQEKTWQPIGCTEALVSVACADHSWTLNSSTVKHLQRLRSHPGTLCLRTRPHFV